MEWIPARAASNVPAASSATRRMMIASALISGEIILPLPLCHHCPLILNDMEPVEGSGREFQLLLKNLREAELDRLLHSTA